MEINNIINLQVDKAICHLVDRCLNNFFIVFFWLFYYHNMKFSNEEKVDMIFVYARAFRNADNAVRIYRELYPERRIPDRKIFARLEHSLREHGTFENPQKRKLSITAEGGECETNVLGT